jgi:peptidoglycan/LPS O-acetylase OafA/YrhL
MNLLSGMNGFRAFAALFVVIYHLNQHLPTGGFGYFSIGIHQFIGHFSIMVSVFFMLSGFFRSLSYWKCIDTPDSIPLFFPSIKDRFFRIAPAYYVMLIVSLIATYFISGISSINFPAFFVGFTFLTWISPDTLFPVILNGPLWFISLDMIGWIMTSLIMMGMMKINKNYHIPYIITIGAIMLGLHFLWISLPWTPGEGISFVWFPIYNPFLFFLHFLFGIAAAGIVTWLRRK